MKSLKHIFPIMAMSLPVSLMGCSTTSTSSNTQALFETRAEAEQAAKNFHCTGAHQMGTKWMPCENHNGHEGREKHGRHHH